MDVSAFSGSEFDVKAWINKTFKQQEATQNKKQYAQSLVMKLQLLIAKLNANLEEQSEHIIQSMPRVVREVEALQQEAALLRSSMSAVQNDIDKVNAETGASMETLVKLDLLKQRIQITSRALQEADNWTTLTNEIEDAMDSGDLAVISQKLNGIQGSLKILSHVPDYDDRVIMVEGLKNRLEALASPKLVAAFNATDAEKSKVFVKIFADMERSQQLLKYYRKCTRAKLVKKWANIVEDNEQLTVYDWSKMFFSHVKDKVEEQFLWFTKVFGEAGGPENMIDILIDAFYGLDPTLDFCLSAGLKQQTDPLQFLIDVKLTFNDLLESLDQFVEQHSTGQACQTKLRELSKIVYSPFKPFIAKYEQMESTKLLAELEATTTTSKDILVELRNVSLSVAKFITSLNSASARCCQLSEGCAYQDLISAYEECLAKYLERFANLMGRLEKRKTAAHSWSILQQSLTLNQTCGELLLSVEQLDMTLAIEFLDRTKPFLGPSDQIHNSKAIHQHHLFLLDSNSAQMKQLNEFYAQVKQGLSYPIVGTLLKLARRTCEELQSSTFAILFHPIREQVAVVNSQQMLEKVWTSTSAGMNSREPDMPDFSFSPQEYITQIGQYLMTLPQHLEPYMTLENPSLARALQEKVFPHCGGIKSGSSRSDENEQTTPADFLLSCIARATCKTYLDHIQKIPTLSVNSTKQLYTDIGYLGDILDDLGHPLTDDLQSFTNLLKLPAKDFSSSASNEPHKLVSQVKQMRLL